MMAPRSNLRAPCSTTNGYFGFVHPNARPGDEIFAFLGAPVPFVLRKANATEYTIVGECYLHGFMSGEAMTDSKIELQDLTIVWGFSLCKALLELPNVARRYNKTRSLE